MIKLFEKKAKDNSSFLIKRGGGVVTPKPPKGGLNTVKARGLFFMLILLFPLAISIAQSSTQSSKQKKEQLQQQMKALRKEIADMEKQLAETSSKKKENLAQVQILTDKIKKREALIANFNSQIDDLEDNIEDTKSNIDSQTVQVEKMKKDYAQMLRTTYSNLALQNQYTFIISSSSFNEAIARYSYLKRISEYRRKQAEELDKLIHDLEGKKASLEDSKKEKEDLLAAQSAQKQKLLTEKQETDKMIAQLSDKEKKQRRYVEIKNKAAEALNNKIQKIIEDEIKMARKKAEDEAKRKALAESKAKSGSTTATTAKTTTKAQPVMMSPKDQELTNDFASNKGKLPWPVAKGSVVGAFGKHEHPTLKGVYVENNGLDIKTTDGANGRAVFKGSVISVFTLPTTQTCIIVKHGEYFTVYSNIADAAVRSNDNITTKQNIGSVYTDKTDSQTKIHIEIWKGKDKLNPAEWLTAN